MRIRLCIFLFLLSTAASVAQSTFHKFRKLSRPEKGWVLAHPFKAKKAMRITSEVLVVVDTIKRSGIIGTDIAGGKLDAFKHAYWMARLSLELGEETALALGKAHEKGNYLQYKKHKLEDSILPDSVSSAMDMRNNVVGAGFYGNCRTYSKKDVQGIILKKLKNGELSIIKKDAEGHFVYCDGTLINMSEWQGKWNIPKCLVTSDTE